MRILTHNHLICVVKTCTKQFPLRIDAVRVESEESEFSGDFIKHILGTVDYEVLRQCGQQLGLPIPDSPEGCEDEALQQLHNLLIDV